MDETYIEKYFIIQTDSEIPKVILLAAAGENSKFSEQGELRGFGDSYSLQTALQQDVDGLVGSRALASMSPDELPRLSDKELSNVEEFDADFDRDNPYRSYQQTRRENCDFEEQ